MTIFAVVPITIAKLWNQVQSTEASIKEMWNI